MSVQKYTTRTTLTILAVVLGIAIIPAMLGKYPVYLMNGMCIAIIIAVGLNLSVGYSGQVNLGQSAFVGIGAYATAILMARVGLSFWVAMPLGAVTSAVVGMLVAVPSLRLKGVYLALVTFGFASIVEIVLILWVPLTNGPDGLVLPNPRVGNYALNSEIKMFYLIYAITVALTYCANNIVNSRTGRAFIAIRESEAAAKAIGINIPKYKVIAFMLSSFYGGLAGGLYAISVAFISPDAFNILESVIYVSMIVVGGLGSIVGSIIGGALLFLLPELLRGAKEIQELLYGAIIILSIIFLPRGIAGLFCKVKGG